MVELLEKPEFWSAIVQLAWPLTAVVIAILFRKYVAGLLNRERLTIKVAGMEISVTDATEQAGKNISDLQERIARLENAMPEGAISPAIQSVATNRLSVLWVDDFPSNNAFIIEKLENDGVRVRKELSTDAALSAIASDSFDLIISDLGRIEGGRENPFAGLDFTRALRTSGNQTPLLIFAGRRGLENENQLIKAGATEVANSPIGVFRFVENYREVNSTPDI